MVTKLIKKNLIAKELYTRKYKPRTIKPKKGKRVLNEKNDNVISDSYK